MSRDMEIREEIATLSEQYDAFLRKFGYCEVLDSLADEAEDLLEEFKSTRPDPDVEHCSSRMEDILVEFARIILSDPTRVSHDDLRYFIYNEMPVEGI